MACTSMMLHSAIHWPEMGDQVLWPMAVAHAIYIYNHVPLTESGVCPSDLFTKMRWEQRKFHDLHVWGCPVYVLDKHLRMGGRFLIGNQGLSRNFTHACFHHPSCVES